MTEFKEGATVKTTVYMSVEDIGTDVPVGTKGKIFLAPSDAEALVGVEVEEADGKSVCLHYLPQDVLEVTGISTVIGSLSVQTIPEDALLHRIVKDLQGREAFKDADSSNNERMYHGDVFEAILNEYGESGDSIMNYPPQKVIEQLEELAQLITADYVLVTLS